ncbi:endoribonuclease Dicer homolog 3 [Euphorbia lathyris]|uniref:endoribonuclease Dicer homolog 3 n=1 Tax=Euphorbia lathyris TaxID=212925 RepID=UPI00331314C4
MSKSSDLGSNAPDATQESVPPASGGDFIPRSYQKEVFDVAMKRNTLAVLETGAGKTMIAVMLIREIGGAIKSAGDKRLIIFLAPTVVLVKQQGVIIKDNTNLDVEEYYGSKGVDDWTLQSWEKEIAEHDVFVMTPQILLDALRKAFLNLEMVSLIIIDECHHATRNHPYTKIMKEFYRKSINKPKVFGMTASPVVRKGVSSSMDCKDQLLDLESLLDSQIYTIEDKAELNLHVPSAREKCRFYDKEQFDLSDLKSKIESSWSKFDAAMLNLQGSTGSNYKDVDEKLKVLRQRLSNDYTKILGCMEDLGLICTYEAVKVCLENIPNSIKECGPYREISAQHKFFLEEVLSIIAVSLSHGADNFLDHQFDFIKAINMGQISPKLYELLQLFLSFGEATEILCLIFVDKILTAKVIERFVKKVAVLGHLAVSYVTGTNSSNDALKPKTQKETLESFSSGKLNLLFSTDVLREGISVRNCSCVICFDLPKTVCCYVQSRGRARQSDSQYIMMLERGNTGQKDLLFDFIRSEWLMTNTAINRDPDVWTPKACTSEEIKAYVVDVTGASVTEESSVNLIYRYCAKLPANRYYTPRPTFEFQHLEQSCQCTLNLPASAAFQTIAGPLCRSQNLAKHLVCLEACKKLHQMGALDDHLVPSIGEPIESNSSLGTKESAGAGTTKRKELHGTTRIHALSGNWGGKLDGATFHAYKFQFSCSIISETFPGFVLLTESKLDDDVGNIELDLFLLRKTVKASISSCGQMQLDAEKIAKAKCCHELFFNGLFGKLFTGSKSKPPREFLLQKGTGSLWDSSNMYLLLPLETLGASTDESLEINWRGMIACTEAVEFLKKNSYSGVDGEQSSPCRAGSSITECGSSNSIYFANILADVDKVKNTVAVAIHTGKIYSVLDLVSDTAESPFEHSPGEPTKYSSYVEYFDKKYGIALRHPGQHLLLLKQSHKPHNLLSNNDEDTSKKKAVDEKQRQFVHMPPELLVSVEIPAQILKSFYLLPSLMHRLESLMLASQLRKEIDCGAPNFYIPSSLILEALTTQRASETFSMERFELLGDSVLKYSVSCDLFLRYPTKHEGQLSDRRIQTICNSTLHKFGIGRKLQEYIRDSAFIPRSWVAPGQLPTYYVPCNCGVDTLEVPLDTKFRTTDPQVKLVTCCSMGHRWMCSKTISDCVEAMIGAYYVSGGLVASLHLMKWLGMDIQFDLSLVDEAIIRASLRSYEPKENELESLELKLGYTFSSKFLLQEAVTHASMHEKGIGYSYERLEFLGDAVVDLLITWHLYQSYTSIDPGELTDLRSACISNDNFAQVVVRRKLYEHLQHCSTALLSHITEYLNSFTGSDEVTKSAGGPNGPKALGDLLESIAGAMLIDTRFNLDQMWQVWKPLLSPLPTPQNLELAPWRTLNELCDSLGYFVKEKDTSQNEAVHVELRLQLNDVLLVGNGYDRNTKAARGKAASQLLKDLESRGMIYTWGDSKKRKQDRCHVVDSTDECINGAKHKKQKLENQPQAGSCGVLGSPNPDGLVIESINMKKGAPRSTLFELCKKASWMWPVIDTTEEKSRTPLIYIENGKTIERFNNFVTKITVNIPNQGCIECTGEGRPDKKSAYDSAAVAMLYKLREEGYLTISSESMIED